MADEAEGLYTGICVDPEPHEGCVVSGLGMRTHVHVQRVWRPGPCGSTPSDSRCVWPIRNNSCNASSSRTQAALRNSSRILSVAKSLRFAVGRRAAARSSDLYRLIAGCVPPTPPPISDAVYSLLLSWGGLRPGRLLFCSRWRVFALGGDLMKSPARAVSEASAEARVAWPCTEALSPATAAQVSEASAGQATQSGALDVGHIWSSD